MMKLATLLLALAAVGAHAQESRCMSSCEFYFCGGDSNVEVGARNDIALTSPICRTDGGQVGVVHTGEAHRMSPVYGGKPTPISKLGLPKSFFKAYNLNDHLHNRKLSGIGHQKVRRCQLRLFVNDCWIIPVRDYQKVKERRGGDAIFNVNADNADTDCISFSSTAPISSARCENEEKPTKTPEPKVYTSEKGGSTGGIKVHVKTRGY